MIKFIALGAIAAAFFGGNGAIGAVGAVKSESSKVSASDVSGVEYALSKTKPGMVDSVSFTLKPAGAKTVLVRLSADDAGHTCTKRAGRVTCSLGAGYSAEAVTLLDVTTVA